MKRLKRKLYRSRSGVVFGVCKGLAEWLNVSELLVRTVWVVLVLLTGIFPFAILYLLLAYFLPERDLFTDHDSVEEAYRSYRRRFGTY